MIFKKSFHVHDVCDFYIDRTPNVEFKEIGSEIANWESDMWLSLEGATMITCGAHKYLCRVHTKSMTINKRQCKSLMHTILPLSIHLSTLISLEQSTKSRAQFNPIPTVSRD